MEEMMGITRRDDHYIDTYMTLLHIWWLINRIKTFRFGLSIDIGHDGVIDHMKEEQLGQNMPMFLIFEWNIKTPDRYPIISVRSILDAFCSPLLTGWCVLLLLAIQRVLIYRLGTHFLTDQHTVETCVSLDSWPVYIIRILRQLLHSGLKCFI